MPRLQYLWQQCNGIGGGKGCPSRDCVYIPEVLDDVEEFDNDDCLMHGDNELCDTSFVANILDVLKNDPSTLSLGMISDHLVSAIFYVHVFYFYFVKRFVIL